MMSSGQPSHTVIATLLLRVALVLAFTASAFGNALPTRAAEPGLDRATDLAALHHRLDPAISTHLLAESAKARALVGSTVEFDVDEPPDDRGVVSTPVSPAPPGARSGVSVFRDTANHAASRFARSPRAPPHA